MEARPIKRKWKFDDTKWIIGLLLTLITIVSINTATVSGMSKKVNRIWREYITISQVTNIFKLVQNERSELVAISKKDSIGVNRCLEKYEQLIIDWNEDLNRTRAMPNTLKVSEDTAWQNRLYESTKKYLSK